MFRTTGMTAVMMLAWVHGAAAMNEWDPRLAPAAKAPSVVLDNAARQALVGRKRMALVIGNGSGYALDPLAKASQDAASMAAMLKSLGYTVYGLHNATRGEMERTLKAFVDQAQEQNASEVLFYYSGHGVQVNGVNYLIPVDMSPETDEIDIHDRAVNMSMVMQRLGSLNVPRIVLLDACRNNPFAKGFKSPPRGGLASIAGGNGSLVAFATQADTVASVGSDRYPHSVFTEFFMQALAANPKRPIDDVLKQTRTLVDQATEGHQQPEYTYNLPEPLALLPGTCKPAKEKQEWEKANSANSTQALRDFLTLCPDGEFSAVAATSLKRLARIEELERQGAATSNTASTSLPQSQASSLPATLTTPTTANPLPPVPEIITLATPPFRYFAAPEVQRLHAKGLEITKISESRNNITDYDEWLSSNNLQINSTNKKYRENTEDEVKLFTINSESTLSIYGKEYYGTKLAIHDNDGRIYRIYDFINYTYPQIFIKSDKKYIYMSIRWAERQGDILYVSYGHPTYAYSSMGNNAFIAAININTGNLIWHSDPLVSNARNFVLIGDHIVSGYGFTDEDDYLYVISKTSGRTLSRQKLKTGPDWIIKKDNKLYVRTYDTDYVFRYSVK